MPNNESPLPRPLYGSVGPQGCDPSAHAGLWYDKFCNQWQGQDWAQCKVNKLPWIKTVTERPVGRDSLLSEYATRRRQMVDALGGKCLDLVTESRFVTGLGREHPVENGFAWHATLGTPYLPGSSIKGIARARARQFAIPGADSNSELILGNLEQVGRVILLDALPLEPVKLEADVMTPHYGSYYQPLSREGLAKGSFDVMTPHYGSYYQSLNPDRDPPGDWMSPVPIPFLVVAPEARFQFALVPRTRSAASCLPTVEGWLREALAWLGGGAKTAVGYGRFIPPVESTMGEALASQTPTATAPSPAPTRNLLYKPGNRVTVKRVQDPKGKDRPWFEADDGFSGTLTGIKSEEVPGIALGQTITLEIGATLMEGYNFRWPREKKQDRARKLPGKR